MYNDTEDMLAPHNTTPLENIPPMHSITKQDGEATTESVMIRMLNMIY